MVSSLQTFPQLKQLTLIGNPIYLLRNYRALVIRALPNLIVLDDTKVTPEERATGEPLDPEHTLDSSLFLVLEGLEKESAKLRIDTRNDDETNLTGLNAVKYERIKMIVRFLILSF